MQDSCCRSLLRQQLGIAADTTVCDARFPAAGATLAVHRTRSMMLVPCASQELPAPQLMQVELPARSPLPALSALANTCTPAPAQPTTCQSLDLLDTAALPGVGATCLPLTPVATSLASGLSAEGGRFDAASAEARAQAGPAQPAGNEYLMEEVQQMPDDVQAGLDSPRELHRGGHRRSMTPLLEGHVLAHPDP